MGKDFSLARLYTDMTALRTSNFHGRFNFYLAPILLILLDSFLHARIVKEWFYPADSSLV